MATLNIPYSFTAGTPAVASQVNANFDAIVNWANGGISTDAFGLLTARTIALPSAPLPLKTIVPVYQTAAEPALYIVNDSQGVPVTIVQDQAFGSSGKAVIKISDTTTQIQSGSPTVWLDLASAATAPAFLVQHGSVDTMRLTRTQLDLFNGAVQATATSLNLFGSAVQASSAGVVSATTVAATDVNTTNVTATGLLDLTAPASDAIVAEIKGRSSDNNAIVQFKSNDDATVYASATSSPSGLTLNLPDTADSYTFQVNDVTKAVINNSGIDAQYLYNLSDSALPALPSAASGVITSTVSTTSEPGEPVLGTMTLTTTKINARVALEFGQYEDVITNASRGFSGFGSIVDTGGWRIEITGPSGFSQLTRYGHSPAFSPDVNRTAPTESRIITLGAIGTYTFALKPHRWRSYSFPQNYYGWSITNHIMRVFQLR